MSVQKEIIAQISEICEKHSDDVTETSLLEFRREVLALLYSEKEIADEDKIQVICFGITKAGIRCKRRAFGASFCSKHKSQKIHPPLPPLKSSNHNDDGEEEEKDESDYDTEHSDEEKKEEDLLEFECKYQFTKGCMSGTFCKRKTVGETHLCKFHQKK
ncbi:MAG: hypothetical protein Solivirus2_53 [Solivirus sp.]|uniref:Uncharacterized protein n=1 Tax=Solivirus sp. TaxID=2487772 RepID=A0A3G5AFN0_9VIRU|nr:MAG: hypothetical protein Solivirus2_53 [Solivirus sp.]